MLDNSSTHKTSSIQRWLVRHPRFTLHFTPTYSSWLNLVERWFAELTTKWIKRGAHRSVRDLVASIRTWIAGWNDDPRPFVWHKTADEILDSLAAYCQRIDDSGCWKRRRGKDPPMSAHIIGRPDDDDLDILLGHGADPEQAFIGGREQGLEKREGFEGRLPSEEPTVSEQ